MGSLRRGRSPGSDNRPGRLLGSAFPVEMNGQRRSNRVQREPSRAGRLIRRTGVPRTPPDPTAATTRSKVVRLKDDIYVEAEFRTDQVNEIASFAKIGASVDEFVSTVVK